MYANLLSFSYHSNIFQLSCCAHSKIVKREIDMQLQLPDVSKANEPPEYEALAEESTGEPPVRSDDLPSPAREELYDKRMKEFKELISARQTELRQQVWNLANMKCERIPYVNIQMPRKAAKDDIVLNRDTYETNDYKIASTAIDERWKLPKYWILRMNDGMLAVWATAFKEQPQSVRRLGELVKQIHDTGIMGSGYQWLNWGGSFGSLQLSEYAIISPKNDVELLERMRLFQAAVGKTLADLVNSYGEEPVWFLGRSPPVTREATVAFERSLNSLV